MVTFENCGILTSKVDRSLLPVKAVWRLEGLNDPNTRDLLRNEAKAEVKMELGGGRTSILEFRLGDFSKDEMGGASYHYLSLEALLKNTGTTGNGVGSPSFLEVEVHSLDEQLKSIGVFAPKSVIRFETTNQTKQICQDLIFWKEDPNNYTNCHECGGYVCVSNNRCSSCGHYFVQGGYGTSKATRFEQLSAKLNSLPSRLLYGIIVTPIQCNRSTNSANHSTCLSESMSQLNITPLESVQAKGSVFGDFGHFYSTVEDNYSDLKLESRDGMILNTHKFVVASRSSVFHAMIEKETKENAFNGVIKIADVDAKPLQAILHWMYTGMLQEDCHKFVEDLIHAAKAYGLEEMLNILDKELIKMCNPDNMMRLFKVAKEIGMETAMVQIVDFIKGNL